MHGFTPYCVQFRPVIVSMIEQNSAELNVSPESALVFSLCTIAIILDLTNFVLFHISLVPHSYPCAHTLSTTPYLWPCSFLMPSPKVIPTSLRFSVVAFDFDPGFFLASLGCFTLAFRKTSRAVLAGVFSGSLLR